MPTLPHICVSFSGSDNHYTQALPLNVSILEKWAGFELNSGDFSATFASSDDGFKTVKPVISAPAHEKQIRTSSNIPAAS
jgi:hypothetical protein